MKYRKHSYCSEDDLNVKISTVSKDAEEKDLDYYYLVSSGQIIGQGKDVIWNFADTHVGEYTITVGVGKGDVLYGNLITKTIKMIECPECDLGCSCPTLKISRPAGKIQEKNSFVLRAKLEGLEDEKPSYDWKITGGTIISGQGNSQIIVKPNKNSKEVNVSIEIGDLCPSCLPTTDSFTLQIQ